MSFVINERESNFQLLTPKEQIANAIDVPVAFIWGWLCVCGCSFLNLANFLTEKEDVGLDFQVLIKLGFIGAGGLYGLHGLLTRKRVWTLLTSFPVAWIPIICVLYLFSAACSEFTTNSLVSTCSIVAVVLMTVTALVHLGVYRCLQAMFTGMGLFIFFSWLTFLFVPSVGVFAEPIAGGQFTIRMSGLAHPNTLGQYAGLTVIVSTIFVCSYKVRHPLIFLIALLAVGALVGSLSRTSLVACVGSLLIGYRHIYFRQKYLLLYISAATIALLAVLVLSTQIDLEAKIADKLSLLSKSGDADELTTATGRSEIWAHGLQLLAKQPLTGYGAATQKYYFAEHSLYTHNMLLNIAFSAGAFAGIAAFFMIAGRLRALFFNRHPLADSITVFIIVNGLFENVIFSILCGLPTILWVVALCWPLLSSDPAVSKLQRNPEKNEATNQPRLLRLAKT
jgi:O-antigen ligase